MHKEPRAKKHKIYEENRPLPLFHGENAEFLKFSAHFDGLSVIVDNYDEMKTIYCNGYFGKGNFSRGFPCFTPPGEQVAFLRKRQFEQRKKINKKCAKGAKPVKIIVTPDSDNEQDVDGYFTNLKPIYEIDYGLVKETLNLGLEEAFFLFDAVKCLDIHFEGKLLNCEEVWGKFCECDEYFMENYVAYYYFRTKNWVVRNGIKFGGDFSEFSLRFKVLLHRF